MVTESISSLQEGPVHYPIAGSIVINAITNSANVALWGPVKLASAGSGEDLPRVDATNSQGDKDVFGILVGPKKTSYAQGDLVQVCIFGYAKCKVDGANSTIALGTMIQSHAAYGYGEGVAGLDAPASYVEADMQTELDKIAAVFAIALTSASADGDIIPVLVVPSIFK